jgi:hypothetical protein
MHKLLQHNSDFAGLLALGQPIQVFLEPFAHLPKGGRGASREQGVTQVTDFDTDLGEPGEDLL